MWTATALFALIAFIESVSVPITPNSSLIAAIGSMLCLGVTVAFRHVNGSRREPSPWTFDVGGIVMPCGRIRYRLSWRAYRAVTARGRKIRIARRGWGRPKLILVSTLSPDIASRASRAIEGMRRAAARVPAASPPTGAMDVFGACRRCGAMYPVDPRQDPTPCAVCGESLEPTCDRIVIGRSSPGALYRRLRTPLLLVLTGVGATVALLTTFASTRSGAIALAVGGALTTLLFAPTWLRRDAYLDRVWHLADNHLGVSHVGGEWRVPWPRVRGVDVVAHRARWTHLRLLSSPEDPGPRDLWIDTTRDSAAAVVAAVAARRV